MSNTVNIYVPKDKMEVVKKAKNIYGSSFSSLVVLLVERYVKSYEKEEKEEEQKNESNSNPNGDESIQ